MQISFKIESLYKGIDPYKVYDEIQSLGENVKPEMIVAAAQDSNSELHKCFEWDDTEAARKYRIIQAGNLVRNLVIVESKEKSEPQQIRVMYTSQDGGYKQTTLILQQPDEYETLKNRAMAELRAIKNKYNMILELKEIFDLID